MPPKTAWLFCFAVLVGAVPAQAPSDDASIGVWPWLVGNIDADVPNIIAQTQAAGLDTIYLHLFRTTGVGVGTLHMVDEAGTWDPLNGPIDADVTLRSFISQAHAAHLQVVGVVNCFLDVAPLPGNTVHEDLLIEVIDYLVNSFEPSGAPRYALDGIALDRCRFYAGTNNNDALVTAFVQRVKARLGRMPLHAFVMANLYTFDGPTYDGNFNSYASCINALRSQFGQNWPLLAPYLDVTLPMSYISEASYYGSDTNKMRGYVQATAAYARQAAIAGGRPDQRVVPAIRAWTDATGVTTSASLDASIVGALNGGDGFMPFRYYTMVGQPSWWNTVAARTVPGPSFPRPAFSASPAGNQTLRLDATATSSLFAPGASLELRFDVGDDGVPDTPWSTARIVNVLLPTPGSHRISLEVRDPAGHVAVAKRRVTLNLPSLAVGSGVISAAAGGTRTFTIDPGVGAAGGVYLVGGSLSGSSPGIPLGNGVVVPLVFDAVTEACWLYANSPVLPGFTGTLDGLGRATAALVLPAQALPPSLVWSSFTFAAVGARPGIPGFAFASNAVSLLVLP